MKAMSCRFLSLEQANMQQEHATRPRPASTSVVQCNYSSSMASKAGCSSPEMVVWLRAQPFTSTQAAYSLSCRGKPEQRQGRGRTSSRMEGKCKSRCRSRWPQMPPATRHTPHAAACAMQQPLMRHGGCATWQHRGCETMSAHLCQQLEVFEGGRGPGLAPQQRAHHSVLPKQRRRGGAARVLVDHSLRLGRQLLDLRVREGRPAGPSRAGRRGRQPAVRASSGVTRAGREVRQKMAEGVCGGPQQHTNKPLGARAWLGA